MIIKAMIAALLFQCAFASDVKILSWNVFMLPKPLKSSRQKERMVVIKDTLLAQDHDVLVLQESFSDLFRGTLYHGLLKKYPHQMVLGKSTSIKKRMNSGVFILSKFPFKRLGYRYYTYCGKSDCFASKGVMLIEMALPGGKVVQIAGTHMQAGSSDSMKEVRVYQSEQIKELLNEFARPGIPQILVGDLNMDALLEGEFNDALQRLDLRNDSLSEGSLRSSKSTQTSCFGKSNSTEASWLDHILVRDNESGLVQQDKRIFRLTGLVNGQYCDLSDHLPVSATFSITH